MTSVRQRGSLTVQTAKHGYVKFKRHRHTIFVTTALPTTIASLKSGLLQALQSLGQNEEVTDNVDQSIDLATLTSDDIEVAAIQSADNLIEEAAGATAVTDEEESTNETLFVWRFKGEDFQITPYPEDDEDE